MVGTSLNSVYSCVNPYVETNKLVSLRILSPRRLRICTEVHLFVILFKSQAKLKVAWLVLIFVMSYKIFEVMRFSTHLLLIESRFSDNWLVSISIWRETFVICKHCKVTYSQVIFYLLKSLITCFSSWVLTR